MTHLYKVSSGIHCEPFYTKHYLPTYNINERIGVDLEFTISDEIIRKEMEEHSIEDYNNDEDYFFDSIRCNLEDDCLMYNYVYEPRAYKEDIAHLCHLIPFTLTSHDCNLDLQLLSFGGCGMDMTYKLEAYQLLADHSYDEHSNFAKDGISYFEYYYGKGSRVVKEIRKLIPNRKIAA